MIGFVMVGTNNLDKAIKLYEKMNFKIEGIMFQNYYNREKNFFEDVIYMSLFNEKLFK